MKYHSELENATLLWEWASQAHMRNLVVEWHGRVQGVVYYRVLYING